MQYLRDAVLDGRHGIALPVPKEDRMPVREWIFAVLLVVAGGFVVTGVSAWSSAAAWVAAGVLLAGWSWLVLGEVDR